MKSRLAFTRPIHVVFPYSDNHTGSTRPLLQICLEGNIFKFIATNFGIFEDRLVAFVAFYINVNRMAGVAG